MSLLDDRILWVVGAFFALAIIGAPFVSRRITKKWWGLFLHALVICTASGLILLGTALLMNRENLWYGSVRELLGKTDLAKNKVEQGGTKANPFATASAAPTVVEKVYPPLPSPGQPEQVFEIPSSLGKESFAATVVLPDGYHDPANAKKSYPVLMLGLGFPGTPYQWLSVIHISAKRTEAVANKQINNFIAVIPHIWPNNVDTECGDGPGAPLQIEKWLAADVPAFLKSHLRTQEDRTSWAWLGISSGGYCGMFQALHYPEVYAGAASLGGYFTPEWEGAGPLFPLDAQGTDRMDLLKVVSAKSPPIALWIFNGKTEIKYIRESRSLSAAAKEPMQVTLVTGDGGHNWDTWKARVPPALEWIGKTFPGFNYKG